MIRCFLRYCLHYSKLLPKQLYANVRFLRYLLLPYGSFYAPLRFYATFGYRTLISTLVYAFTLPLATLSFFLRYSTFFTLTLATLPFFLRYSTFLRYLWLSYASFYATLSFYATFGYPTLLCTLLYVFTLPLAILRFFLCYYTLFTLLFATLRFFLRYSTLFTLSLAILRFFLRYSTFLRYLLLPYVSFYATLCFFTLSLATLRFFLRHIQRYSTLLSAVPSTYFLPFFLRHT